MHTGKEWLLPKLDMKPNEAVTKGWELRAATVDVLQEFEARGEQKNGWPELIREVLRRETAMTEYETKRL